MLKVSMIIQTHLSDILIEALIPSMAVQVVKRTAFIKLLLYKYPDTTTLVDADAEWDEFVGQ